MQVSKIEEKRIKETEKEAGRQRELLHQAKGLQLTLQLLEQKTDEGGTDGGAGG